MSMFTFSESDVRPFHWLRTKNDKLLESLMICNKLIAQTNWQMNSTSMSTSMSANIQTIESLDQNCQNEEHFVQKA